MSKPLPATRLVLPVTLLLSAFFALAPVASANGGLSANNAADLVSAASSITAIDEEVSEGLKAASGSIAESKLNPAVRTVLREQFGSEKATSLSYSSDHQAFSGTEVAVEILQALGGKERGERRLKKLRQHLTIADLQSLHRIIVEQPESFLVTRLRTLTPRAIAHELRKLAGVAAASQPNVSANQRNATSTQPQASTSQVSSLGNANAQPGLVLVLASRSTFHKNHALQLAALRALQRTGGQIQFLSEKPDLSRLDSAAEISVVSHGSRGHLPNSDELVALLNDKKFGLHKDFAGKINLLVCESGSPGSDDSNKQIMSAAESIADRLTPRAKPVRVRGYRGMYHPALDAVTESDSDPDGFVLEYVSKYLSGKLLIRDRELEKRLGLKEKNINYGELSEQANIRKQLPRVPELAAGLTYIGTVVRSAAANISVPSRLTEAASSVRGWFSAKAKPITTAISEKAAPIKSAILAGLSQVHAALLPPITSAITAFKSIFSVEDQVYGLQSERSPKERVREVLDQLGVVKDGADRKLNAFSKVSQ